MSLAQCFAVTCERIWIWKKKVYKCQNNFEKKISIVKYLSLQKKIPPRKKRFMLKKKYYLCIDKNLFKLYKCVMFHKTKTKNSYHFFDTHQDMISKWMKEIYVNNTCYFSFFLPFQIVSASRYYIPLIIWRNYFRKYF